MPDQHQSAAAVGAQMQHPRMTIPGTHAGEADVAAGVSEDHPMLSAHQRLLCLFGYEANGGDTSRLWQDPEHVVLPAGPPGRQLVERFQAWQHSKRAFRRGEVITGAWITIRAQGSAAQVQFHPDGTVTETMVFAPWTQQPGTWSLVAHAVVRLHVAGRELDIIANRTGFLHSGIEEHHEDATYRVYVKVIHVPMHMGR